MAKLGTGANDPVLIRGGGLALFDVVQRTKQDRNSAAALDLLDREIMSRADDIESIWAYATLASLMKRDLPAALRPDPERQLNASVQPLSGPGQGVGVRSHG